MNYLHFRSEMAFLPLNRRVDLVTDLKTDPILGQRTACEIALLIVLSMARYLLRLGYSSILDCSQLSYSPLD